MADSVKQLSKRWASKDPKGSEEEMGTTVKMLSDTLQSAQLLPLGDTCYPFVLKMQYPSLWISGIILDGPRVYF